MLKKIVIWVLAYYAGLSTISFFPNTEMENLPFVVSEIIMSPFSFFLGMLTFIVTTLALSSFIRSAIEQIFNWINGRQGLTFALVIDLSSVFCYVLLLEKSIFITVLLFVFSCVYGIMTMELNGESMNDSIL